MANFNFNGKMKEAGNKFYTRVSERLRHKGRTIALWDYERLVLQYFPGVYKVKCINHASLSSFADAGHTLIIELSGTPATAATWPNATWAGMHETG